MKKSKFFLSLMHESIRLSPGNNLVMLISTILKGLCRVIEAFFPALIVKCIITEISFPMIVLYIAFFSIVMGIVGIGEKAVSLYSTAAGYRASNMATLNVQGKAMQMPYDDWESEDSFQRIRRGVSASWVFQTITDAVFDELLVAIVLLIPSLYVFLNIHVGVVLILLVHRIFNN